LCSFNLLHRIPSKQDFIFVFPEKDEIWKHDVSDIVKLPAPIRTGRTARSSKQFKFPGIRAGSSEISGQFQDILRSQNIENHYVLCTTNQS